MPSISSMFDPAEVHAEAERLQLVQSGEALDNRARTKALRSLLARRQHDEQQDDYTRELPLTVTTQVARGDHIISTNTTEIPPERIAE